jgi:class 3 adenylate cyclase
LRPCTGEPEQEIQRYHGQVSQHTGDAVMATFNVSGSRIDHAADALEAAAGEVLINDEAHRRMDGSRAGRPWVRDPVRLDLKSFDEPVDAFRLA